MDDQADAVEEIENLESLVLLALSKLQKEKITSKKQKTFAGVSPKKIARYLRSSYCWLDGDIESQVKTALLSCIKTGLVCILNSRKYRLVGPNTKTMVSNCVTRTSHGTNCCCMSILKCFLKTRTCCYVKRTQPQRKTRQKDPWKSKAEKSPRREAKKKGGPKKKIPANCALVAQKYIGTSKSDFAVPGKDPTNEKCDYCMKVHSPPKLKKLCITCYPVGHNDRLTFDNFSPRDEHQSGY